MEKQTANISMKLGLKINGMTIDAFQKEIGKLSHLLDEMKQLSMFRDEEDMTSSEINGIHINHAPYIEAPEIHGGPYWTIRNVELSIGKDEGTD